MTAIPCCTPSPETATVVSVLFPLNGGEGTTAWMQEVERSRMPEPRVRRVPFWIMLVVCAFMTGCANTQQTMKGNPVRIAKTDQERVWQETGPPRRIAVLIGINNFDDKEWTQLSYAEKDADDLASVLNDHRYGQFDKVITLTGRDGTAKEQVLKSVKELSKYNLSKDDTVVLYISSHGTIARTEDGNLHQYVVTRDTRFGNIPATAIDLDQLKDSFNQLRSRKKVMIFAFCHSGQGKSQLSDSMSSELKVIKSPFFVKPIETASEATIVLAASAWGETAREDHRLKNDIYTHFLIEGIKKNDRNDDGAVTITEVHDYAREQTYYFTGGDQRPSMESVVLGVDPIIMSGEVVRSGKPVLYDYSRRYEDMLVFVDGEKKGTLPVGVTVDPGKHRVELRSSDGIRQLYKESFHAEEGDQISLPLLLNGFDQGTAIRLGYQGFLTEEIDNGVTKPMMMLGLSYSNNTYFSPRLGYRADISYGEDEQILQEGSTSILADVTQTTFGLSLLYRNAIGATAFYGGPRLGQIIIKRELALGTSESESANSVSLGGIAGMHFRYKKNVSLALEGTVNYASIQLAEINSPSWFYNVFGGLSVNF